MKRLSLVSVLALTLSGLAAYGADDLAGELDTARRSFDDVALAAVQTKIVEQADGQPDDYKLHFFAAESYRLQATKLRNNRFVKNIKGKEEDEIRDQQAELAGKGLPYAERALELAQSKIEQAQAHRVLGELYAHHIKGMTSGMRYGPKSRDECDAAIKLAPDDPECLRAIGTMYLYNPPFSGGDVPKAIETFTACMDNAPDSDVYPVLLAMAYRKAEDPAQARVAAERALQCNEHNADAQALLKSLD